MTTLTPPFRYDIVGGFLRPAALKEARAQFAAGTIDRAQLTAVEDDAIRALIAKEKEAGLHAVTDGEFRRSMWSLDFLVGLEGVDEVSADHWSVDFKGNKPKGRTTLITDKIGFGDHPFLDHFRFTKEAAGDTLAKQTIPSPAMLHLMCCVREAAYKPIDRYKDADALFADLAAAYRDAVAAFYDAGCRYLHRPRHRPRRLRAHLRRAHQRKPARQAGRPGRHPAQLPRQLPQHLVLVGRLRPHRADSLPPPEGRRPLPGIRQRPRRRLRAPALHRRPTRRARPGHEQVGRARRPRGREGPHPRGRRNRPPRPAGLKPPVRFLVDRRGQRPYRRRPVEEARPGAHRRARRVGRRRIGRPQADRRTPARPAH